MPGTRLRKLREMLKLSRPQFGEVLGIPPTTIKNYELQYRGLGYNVSEAVLNVYGETALLYLYDKRSLRAVKKSLMAKTMD